MREPEQPQIPAPGDAEAPKRWQESIAKALRKPKPAEGWPKREKRGDRTRPRKPR